jgi:hypothetical protein
MGDSCAYLLNHSGIDRPQYRLSGFGKAQYEPHHPFHRPFHGKGTHAHVAGIYGSGVDFDKNPIVGYDGHRYFTYFQYIRWTVLSTKDRFHGFVEDWFLQS